jgi:hypothetical protein
MRENRLRWLLRRKEIEVVRLLKEIYVDGNKGRGRPKNRWGM